MQTHHYSSRSRKDCHLQILYNLKVVSMKLIYLISIAFALLCLLTSISHALLPAEQYWRSVLPSTPLPKVLQRLLHAGTKSTSVYRPNVKVSYLFNYAYLKRKAHPEKYDISNTTVFFLHKDLHNSHNKMWPYFEKPPSRPGFLPRRVADSIPFSSQEIPKILTHFSIHRKSTEADGMKQTITQCEAPGIKGEVKNCATSLESLLDFSVARIGKKLKIISCDVVQEDSKKQEYTIATSPRLISNESSILSHKLSYPYAVYFSHQLSNTELYWIPLVGADGTKIKAIGVCHMDTSSWAKGHIAFQALKAKPGVAICHFTSSDTLVWIPK